jgi:hypothetical protein
MVLVEKRERRRSLGRPRLRWEDNIKMDLRVVGWRGIEWIDLVAGCCKYGNEPSGSIKCGELLE